MIDGLLVLGVAVVLPLALGGRWPRWLAAGAAVAVALALPIGAVAAALVLPWCALAAEATWARRTLVAGSLVDRADALAAAYALAAALGLVVSRFGWTAFDIREPIVQLTAVHYTYAGAAALVLATAALRDRAGRLATGAVLFTAVAPPIIAVGFITKAMVPQVGGAVLMTVGVWLTGALHLRAVPDPTKPAPARVLLAVSGLAIWIPMVLAVAWAAGQHWAIPILSIPDMARTHGLTNAVAFTLCGLLGRRVTASVLRTVA